MKWKSGYMLQCLQKTSPGHSIPWAKSFVVRGKNLWQLQPPWTWEYWDPKVMPRKNGMICKIKTSHWICVCLPGGALIFMPTRRMCLLHHYPSQAAHKELTSHHAVQAFTSVPFATSASKQSSISPSTWLYTAASSILAKNVIIQHTVHTTWESMRQSALMVLHTSALLKAAARFSSTSQGCTDTTRKYISELWTVWMEANRYFSHWTLHFRCIVLVYTHVICFGAGYHPLLCSLGFWILFKDLKQLDVISRNKEKQVNYWLDVNTWFCFGTRCFALVFLLFCLLACTVLQRKKRLSIGDIPFLKQDFGGYLHPIQGERFESFQSPTWMESGVPSALSIAIKDATN